MATVTKENIGNLHDKITVKITKEDYLPEFEKSLKTYSKNANIPGFRKGMVPVGMVKKMYGKGVFQEEVIRKVESELQNYLREEGASYFLQPLPIANDVALDMNKPGDYEFSFEVGSRPTVNLSVLQQMEVTKDRVLVTDEMVDEEIEKIRENAKDSEDVEELNEEEAAKDPKVGFEVVKQGEEGTFDSVQQFSALSQRLQEELKGKKQNDRIDISANDMFADEEKKNAFLKDASEANISNPGEDDVFSLRIVTISVPKERELNEEFFNLVLPGKDLKTLDEFKAALKVEIQKQWDVAATNKADDAIYHKLLDTVEVDLPEQYLKRYLQLSGKEEKTEEQVENEYPSYVKSLKWNLITDALVEENKIEVTPEEVKEATREEVLGYFGNQLGLSEDAEWIEGFVERLMEDPKRKEETASKIFTGKVFDVLRDKVKMVDHEVSKDEFLKMVEEHKH